jgi:hypothetical protein
MSKVRFFDMLNRWETVLVILVLVLTINVGLLFFVYLPRRTAPPAAPLPEQAERTIHTASPGNTTPKITPASSTARVTATSTI